MPRLKHIDNLGTARAINFSCYKHLKLLKNTADFRIVLEEVENARTKHQIAILGYVLMPSHVHFVLYPPDGLELGRVIGDIKSYSAKRILERWKQVNHPMLPVLRIKRDGWLKYAFWQRRCYDHNCRTIESVREIIRYCHMNPVKAGLVSDASDWIWSSNNWYLNCGEIALEIDGIEL